MMPKTPTNARRRSHHEDSSFSKWMAAQATKEANTEKNALRQEQAKERGATDQVDGPQMLKKGTDKADSKVVKDIMEVRRIFSYFDSDQSGTIEPSEFLKLLARLMGQPSGAIDTAEVCRHWDLVDTDANGTITFDEFQAWYCPTFGVNCLADLTDFITSDIVSDEEKVIRDVAKSLGRDNVTIEKIYREFSSLDDDNSGSLEKPEFEKLMQQTISPSPKSPDIPKKVIDRFWMDIDADCSGAVCFKEFASWYLKFFHSDISPMEQYYQSMGAGFRQVDFSYD